MSDFSIWFHNEFKERRERNPNFSMRSFAQWLGISPAQTSQLISGKRPLTRKTAERILNKIGPSPAEKQRLLASAFQINLGSKSVARQALAEDHFRLISDWYHFAILSLTQLQDAKGDPKWISKRLGISLNEAREALDRLLRLKLIETKPVFCQIGNPLEVLSDTPSSAVQKFHKQMLALAAEKIEKTELELKEFQTITLAVHPSKLPLAKKMITEALDEISEVLESKKPKELYALSLQLFPLTKEEPKGGI